MIDFNRNTLMVSSKNEIRMGSGTGERESEIRGWRERGKGDKNDIEMER
jgi:hypothetical protein